MTNFPTLRRTSRNFSPAINLPQTFPREDEESSSSATLTNFFSRMTIGRINFPNSLTFSRGGWLISRLVLLQKIANFFSRRMINWSTSSSSENWWTFSLRWQLAALIPQTCQLSLEDDHWSSTSSNSRTFFLQDDDRSSSFSNSLTFSRGGRVIFLLPQSSQTFSSLITSQLFFLQGDG